MMRISIFQISILLAGLLAALAPRAEAVSATGGTVTTNNIGGTNYIVHTFSSPGSATLTVSFGGAATVEMWGAGGGGGTYSTGATGGGGGYSAGTITLNSGVDYAVMVGAGGRGIAADTAPGTAPLGGGGQAGKVGFSGQGGGLSGIFTNSYTFANALVVAGGGGGGGAGTSPGGAGGGTSGVNGSGSNAGTGATQSAAGVNGFPSNTYPGSPIASGALQGGGSWEGGDDGGGGGGGGGYYGGGAGFNGDNPAGNSGGGGGSAYIGGAGVSGASMTAGSGTTPGNTSSSYYISGVGVGGTGNSGGAAGSNGGNGRVVVWYIASDPNVPAIRNDPATSITTNSATLNGYLTSTGTSATAVWVYWGPTDGTTNATQWANTNFFGTNTIGATAYTTNTADMGVALTPSTTYYYNFFAQNAAGGVWAATLGGSQSFTTYGPPTVAVSAASGIGTGTATLNGRVVSTNGYPGTTVFFCWGTTNYGTSSTSPWTVVDCGPATNGQSFSTTLAGLTYGIRYWYYAYATNAAGEAWSAPTNFVTVAPFGAAKATGGAITNYTLGGTNFTAHIFTSPAWNVTLSTNLTVTVGGNVNYLIVGGGGGGSDGSSGGGGGGGGVVISNSVSLTSGVYAVTVGAGGAHAATGVNSTFAGLTAYGGGKGGGGTGSDGASGGGSASGGGVPLGTYATAGSAIYGAQGNSGGRGYGNVTGTVYPGGGGGGAGGAGFDGSSSQTGNGGIGKDSSISGTSKFYGGGGAGGGQSTGTAGTGGSGVGGNGSITGNGSDGVANSGGGGGGCGYDGAAQFGGHGGSGIVIVRYENVGIALVNSNATSITTTSAVFNATLAGSNCYFDVYAYWGPTDGTNNPAAWSSNAFVGAYNLTGGLASTNIAYANTALTPNTAYYYTFLASNAAVNLWATPSTNFNSAPAPISPGLSLSSSGTFAFGNVITNKISATSSYVLTGSNLIANVSVVPPTGFQVATNGGAYGTTPLTLVPDATSNVNVQINVCFVPLAQGSYSASISNGTTGAITQWQTVSGDGVVQSLSVTPASLAFGTVCTNTPSATTNYTVSGSYLESDVTVTAPSAAFEVSTNSATGFGPACTVTVAGASAPSGGNLSATPVYVRFTPPAAQAYSGSITNSSTGVALQTVGVSGNGYAGKIWTGATSTDWGTAGNWSGGVPGATDDVLIDGAPNGRHPTLDLSSSAVTIKSLTLGSSSASTLTFQNGNVTDRKLIVSSNVTIGASGTLTHLANGASETHRLFVEVAGDLTIAAGGKIDVTAKGYGAGQGPAGAISCHGGLGVSASGGATYGSLHAPTNCGAGYANAGGGAVKLTVTGRTLLNGDITAYGGNSLDSGNQSGAGGSIFLTTGSLEGTGNIRADNLSGAYWHGGGGRVAVVLTAPGSSFTNHTGLITAYGGAGVNGHSAAGTVYLRGYGVAENDGILIIDNSTVPLYGNATTLLSANTVNKTVGEVRLRNNGLLQLAAGETLQVSGVWSNTATAGYGFQADTGSTVDFVNGGVAARVYGDTTWQNLTITNAGKVVSFEAGKTQTVNGTPTFDNRVTLQSTQPGTQWNLRKTGSGTQPVGKVNVQNSHAGTAGVHLTFLASGGTDLGNNINWGKWPPTGTMILLR
jgi:hypothetical protein